MSQEEVNRAKIKYYEALTESLEKSSRSLDSYIKELSSKKYEIKKSPIELTKYQYLLNKIAEKNRIMDL